MALDVGSTSSALSAWCRGDTVLLFLGVKHPSLEASEAVVELDGVAE